MPLWNDLAIEVSDRMNTTSSGSAIRELSNYSASRTKFELVKLLMECLHIRTPAKPGAVHKEFAKLPFRQVITTNFDFLIERAYDACNRPCLPVVDEELLPFSAGDNQTRLIKMHGDLHHPSLLVVTEEDYDAFRDRRRRMFQEIQHLLIRHSVLFIGYSLEDPDFRQILALVKKDFPEFRRPAYALLVDPTEDTVAEFKRRGVTGISLPGGKAGYGPTLAKTLRAINSKVTTTPNGVAKAKSMRAKS